MNKDQDEKVLINPFQKPKRRLTPYTSTSELKKNFENMVILQNKDSSAEIQTEHKKKSIFKFTRKSNSFNISESNLLSTTKQHNKDKFLIVGVDEEGLELFQDDEFILNPKITYNYPNNIKEHELEL